MVRIDICSVSISLIWRFRDRRKLTFYFIAEKRIDFRELVRELFRCAYTRFFFFLEGILVLIEDVFFCRLYKTRIWMASIQGGGISYEQG
jgi:hypothetical protein